MKAAQTNFVAIFAEQMGINSELRLTESATSLRGNLEAALRNYLNVVTAMNQLEGWKNLYTELNEAVKAARNSSKPGQDVTPVTPVN